MPTITDLISHTAQRYAKAMAIIHAHQGNIQAAEALVETLNEIGGTSLYLCVSTNEHSENLAPEDKRSVSIVVWADEFHEAALRRAIAEADLHIASEEDGFDWQRIPRTTITLSDIDGVEIRINRKTMKEAA